MYSPQAERESIGTQHLKSGLDARFRPWYFDGSTVFWGELCSTEAKALEQAETMKQALR